MTINSVRFEGALTDDTRRIINHNFSDVAYTTTQLDITSSTTLVDVPGMTTGNLIGGQTYKFRITLPIVCTANNGCKFAFKQSVASMLTAMSYSSRGFTASGVASPQNGISVTDQALIYDNVSGVAIQVEITGMVDVALTGTLQLQAAQHNSHADTFSVFKKSQMQFERITVG